MLNIGDRVKIVSVPDNINNDYIERIGIIDKIEDKEHFCYHLSFLNSACPNNPAHLTNPL